MVNVDDLVISLTIKETGKLGQLKKQLDAIVGKRGQKAPSFNLDPSIKADLNYIKRRIIFLMPTSIPGKMRPKAMAETARIAESIIAGKDIRAYAEKITPINQEVLKRTMAEFKVKTRPELVDVLEDKIRDWSLRLESIMSGTWVNDSAQAFLVSIDDMIKRIEVPEGWGKTLMRNIDNSIGERNKEVADILRKIGFEIKAEQGIARIKQEKESKISAGEYGIWREKSLEDFTRAFQITSEENIKLFNELSATIPSQKEGTVKLMDIFAKKLGIPITDLWNLTEKQVKSTEELRVLSGLLLASSGYKFGGERAKGVPLGIQEHMFESLRRLMTAIDPELAKDYAKEELQRIEEKFLEDFEKNIGTTKSDLFERSRIDFLIGNIKKTMSLVKDFFGPEAAEQWKDIDSVFAEQKKIASESNRGQIRDYMGLVGEERLILLAGQIMESFTKMFPKVLSKRMDIALKAEEVGLTTRLTEAQKLEIKAGSDLVMVGEKIDAHLDAFIKEYEIKGMDVMPEFKKIYNELMKVKSMLGASLVKVTPPVEEPKKEPDVI